MKCLFVCMHEASKYHTTIVKLMYHHVHSPKQSHNSQKHETTKLKSHSTDRFKKKIGVI